MIEALKSAAKKRAIGALTFLACVLIGLQFIAGTIADLIIGLLFIGLIYCAAWVGKR